MQHITNNTANKYLGNSNRKYFFFRYISEEEILSVVAQLNNKVLSDCNNISMILITNCIASIIRPLTYICNKLFEFGIFHDSMKISKVIPVFKAGATLKFNKYRLIALLPQFSKILE